MRWFILIPLNIITTLLAALGAPLWALFADKDGLYPAWLQWAATPDYTADGDPPFKEQHAPYPAPTTWAQRYVNRVVWMFRNPAYGFDLSVLAYKPKDGDTLRTWGTRPLSGDLSKSGWVFARSGSAWQLYVTFHWNDTHTTKLNFGWKLWALPNSCQFVFSPTGLWKQL
jgi:hypothetical protein